MSSAADLRRIVGAMTERPWRVWTSNSVRRITAHNQQDGGVLSAVNNYRDHVPDLYGKNRDADLAAIVALANHADALVGLVEECKRCEGNLPPFVRVALARVEAVK